MRSGKFIFSAVLGIAIAFSSGASAQNILEALADAFRGGGPAATHQNGRVTYADNTSRSRAVPSQFRRQMVRLETREKPGTIIVDTRSHYLFLVMGDGRAMRYGIGVGRQGFGWKGAVTVARKAEWPAWHPPAAMRAREAKRGRKLPTRMEGGPNNPLGARALYLHRGGKDTLYRIHGTNEPWTIGQNVSSGCIRLVNDDVIDLYNRVRPGAKVVVL